MRSIDDKSIDDNAMGAFLNRGFFDSVEIFDNILVLRENKDSMRGITYKKLINNIENILIYLKEDLLEGGPEICKRNIVFQTENKIFYEIKITENCRVYDFYFSKKQLYWPLLLILNRFIFYIFRKKLYFLKKKYKKAGENK